MTYKMCSRHDIAEILLELALNTNQPCYQSINQSINLVVLLDWTELRIVDMVFMCKETDIKKKDEFKI